MQATGVDYSAAEDRRLISSIWTPGVLYGLTISAGTGLAVTVSAGRCIINDGAGGCYVAYFDSATTVGGLAASATSNLYVTVNPTTGQATIVKGAAPTTPYLQIGSATTSTAVVTAVSNAHASADNPGAPSSKSLAITGGTLTGEVRGVRFTTATFDANQDEVNAPDGIRLGGAYRTARHAARAHRATVQLITTGGAWQKLSFLTVDRNISDYDVLPLIDAPTEAQAGKFVAAVAGDYHLTGSCYFDPPASGAQTGGRFARIACYSPAGSLARVIPCTRKDATVIGGLLMKFDAVIDLTATYYVQFEVQHSQGTSINVSAGTYAAGDASWGAMRLIQAD